MVRIAIDSLFTIWLLKSCQQTLLTNFFCPQMNCVVCGVDLPVYDHFPLIDGTMYLSPEKNERSTKNCFKVHFN